MLPILLRSKEVFIRVLATFPNVEVFPGSLSLFCPVALSSLSLANHNVPKVSSINICLLHPFKGILPTVSSTAHLKYELGFKLTADPPARPS